VRSLEGAPRSGVAAALAITALASCAQRHPPAWTLRKRTPQIAFALAADAPVQRWIVTVSPNADATASTDGEQPQGELFVRAEVAGVGGAPAAVTATVVSPEGTWGGATKATAREGEQVLLTY
jgi:creatinine amidohydrolase/Fe(II)-dependent formamide hydrolase-like protein